MPRAWIEAASSSKASWSKKRRGWFGIGVDQRKFDAVGVPQRHAAVLAGGHVAVILVKRELRAPD